MEAVYFFQIFVPPAELHNVYPQRQTQDTKPYSALFNPNSY